MSAIECRYRVAPEMLMAAMKRSLSGLETQRRPAGFIALCLAGGVVIGLAVLAAGSALGVSVTGGMVLAFCLGFLAGLALWQITWRGQAERIMQAHEQVAGAAGEVVSRFGPEGVESRSALGQSFTHWGGVTGVFQIEGGTALRLGAIMMPVPDSALPEGITGAVFRAALEGWRRAS